jgi:hypothetical protein
MASWLDQNGITKPHERARYINLQNQIDMYRKNIGNTDTEAVKNLNHATNKIKELVKEINKHGGNLDYASILSGASTWQPETPPEEGPGDEVPVGEPTLVQKPGAPGVVEPGLGGDVTLPGPVDPDSPIPDWIKKASPENQKAYLDWLAYEQSRGDRQTAIDEYGQYGDYLANDPTRTAMQDWISQGPRYSMDPALVDAMKAKNRSFAGNQAAEEARLLREGAARSGQPTSTTGGSLARARAGIFDTMAGRNIDIDVDAARQKAADEAQYWNTLMGGNASLTAPMGSYYGSMAGLIAGTPGLAQTGNPMAGMADYKLAQEQMNAGAMKGSDWLSTLMQGGGMAAQAFGGK